MTEMTEMTEKEPTTKVEVAHITGIQGIRAAMEVLAREASQGTSSGKAPTPGTQVADKSSAEKSDGTSGDGISSALPGVTLEDVPLGRRTCAVCAADNDGSRETCWNCGTSLRRAR